MCALLFYITQSPNCYALLASEIRTTFQSGKFIKGGPLLASCRYLRACIDEALRLAPPTLATLWREQNPKDADTSPLIIDGRIIPKGTHVGVSIYALHHNEAYFSDPFAFRPERWIEANSEEHSRMNMAFIPFITPVLAIHIEPVHTVSHTFVVFHASRTNCVAPSGRQVGKLPPTITMSRSRGQSAYVQFGR